LVLLRLQSGFQGCRLAEMQKPPHFEAKLSQRSNERVRAGSTRLRVHIYIVSRYIYLRNLHMSSIENRPERVSSQSHLLGQGNRP
jgi:hypothetical protein